MDTPQSNLEQLRADPVPALAQALAQARREGVTLPESGAWSLPDVDAAYRVQQAVADALGWFADAPPRCWKSGGASRSAALAHSPLPAHGVRAGPADFSDMHFHAPGIEAEIALRLALDVSPERAALLGHDDARSLVDALAVSIEIVDSRWREPGRTASLLRLADQQSHGALALGEWVQYGDRDWAMQRCEVRIDGAPPAAFIGSHTLADPAWLLPVWLRHATRAGATLLAGTVVTTGTWCGVLPVRAGQRIAVEFEGIGRLEARL